MLKTLALSLCLALGTSPVFAAAERYTLDSEHTTVAFLIEHVGYAKTLGQFSKVSGSFNYDVDTQEVSEVNIVVETNSVNSSNKARDKHVRSKDFLNVKKHPRMVFTAAGTTLTDNVGDIAGELQLLGQTKQLNLSVSLNKADTYPFGHKKFTLGVSAKGELQRSTYGMDYGVANGLVGDSIELIIEIEAMKK